MQKIQTEIDGLSDAESVEELARRTQSVLNKVMYYLSQSEGVIGEHQEGWRNEYTEELYTAARKSHGTSGKSPELSDRAQSRLDSVAHTAGSRPVADNIPPSLRRLMENSD